MLFNLTDNRMNGFEIAFLQSEEYADEIITEFKHRYIGTENPTSLLDDIISNRGIGPQDLMVNSIKRIENEVSNYLEVFNV